MSCDALLEALRHLTIVLPHRLTPNAGGRFEDNDDAAFTSLFAGASGFPGEGFDDVSAWPSPTPDFLNGPRIASVSLASLTPVPRIANDMTARARKTMVGCR